MRPIIVILICIALTTSTASGGIGMYLAEVGIGCGTGLGGVGLGLAVSFPALLNEPYEEASYLIFVMGAFQTVTTGLGVWVTGEYIGDGSSNRGRAFFAAIGGAAVGSFPLLAASYAAYEPDVYYTDRRLGDALFASSLITAPVVSTLFYNIFREPRPGTVETSYDVRPYSDLLADNGTGPVPVYGLSISF